MLYTPLPYKREFLLELTNNNYSLETVENYHRDLNFLESFLWMETKSFEQLDKLSISAYKGYLKAGDHLQAWKLLRDHILTTKEQAELEKMGLWPLPHVETVGNDASKVDAAVSSPNGSKTNFKAKSGLSPRSINRMLSAVRNYLKFLIDIDQKVPLPPDAIKMIKTERKESQVAEIDDLIRLIESPHILETHPLVKARNRAMLELLFSSGMRISEVLNLDREQLHLFAHAPTYTPIGVTQLEPQALLGALLGQVDETVEVAPTVQMQAEIDSYIAGKLYIKGKGKKSRFVYLTQRAKHWLEQYLSTRHDQYPAVFIPYRGGRAGTKDPGTVRISPNYLQERIATYRRAIGIVVPTSAHSLRHGFATYLAEKGASPSAIQRLLGHESLQTTTRYVHTSDQFAEETHRQFHPLQ